ncbi:hypothetical protein [Pelagibius sp.]|uniref:hypothetical protein n=1 Tax=Pelagibius sp. TaxID=1931238 RepID=UPI00261EDBEA|nr:hypothetical protein [Pelagibius sp.]
MTTGPITSNPQAGPSYPAEKEVGIKESGKASPKAGRGNIEDDGVRVSHTDGLPQDEPPQQHDLDHPPQAINDQIREAVSCFADLDTEPTFDLIGLVGKATDGLRKSLDEEKAAFHGTEMDLRQATYDSNMDAAQDEEDKGANALGFSIGEGVADVGTAAIGYGISMNAGSSEGAMMMASTKANMWDKTASGGTEMVQGVEKFQDGNISADEERHKADAEFSGSLQEEINPKDIEDAVKDVNQSYAQTTEQVGQGRSVLAGSLKV